MVVVLIARVDVVHAVYTVLVSIFVAIFCSWRCTLHRKSPVSVTRSRMVAELVVTTTESKSLRGYFGTSLEPGWKNLRRGWNSWKRMWVSSAQWSDISRTADAIQTTIGAERAA